jgi:hypothetical protein
MPSKLADRTDDERGDGSFGLTGPGILKAVIKTLTWIRVCLNPSRIIR